MTQEEICKWVLDAYLMIGEENEKGEDEGKELLGYLLEKLKDTKLFSLKECKCQICLDTGYFTTINTKSFPSLGTKNKCDCKKGKCQMKLEKETLKQGKWYDVDQDSDYVTVTDDNNKEYHFTYIQAKKYIE